MNGNSKIEFTTHNINGKEFSVSSTVAKLLRNWYGDCSMVLDNDADIQKVTIDGEHPLELCKTANNRMTFGKFMRMLEGCLEPVAFNIKWDLDDIEDEAEKDAVNENILPETAEIPVNVAGESDDAITEYLSDTYGYCVKGYTLVWKGLKLDVVKMRQRLYELYQLDWMQRHGFSVQDIINGMADIQNCNLSNLDEDNSVGLEDIDRVDDMYSEFVNDCGFGGGSMWVCYDEFIRSEYREQDYIKELCDVVPDGTELYDLYLHDIKG